MTATAVAPSVAADTGEVYQLTMPEVTSDNSLVTELWFKPEGGTEKSFSDALEKAGYSKSEQNIFTKSMFVQDQKFTVEIHPITAMTDAPEWIAVVSTPLPLSPEGLGGDYDKLSSIHHEILDSEISRIGVAIGDSAVTEFFTPTVSSADPCAAEDKKS